MALVFLFLVLISILFLCYLSCKSLPSVGLNRPQPPLTLDGDTKLTTWLLRLSYLLHLLGTS